MSCFLYSQLLLTNDFWILPNVVDKRSKGSCLTYNYFVGRTPQNKIFNWRIMSRQIGNVLFPKDFAWIIGSVEKENNGWKLWKFGMSFLYPIDWDISFPEEFDNFHANQDKLEENGSGGSGTCRHFQFCGFFSPNILFCCLSMKEEGWRGWIKKICVRRIKNETFWTEN